MTDTIISLCYVNNIKDKIVYLTRIADLRNGRFEEYQRGSNTGPGTDFIIGSTYNINSTLYSVGVYAWYVRQEGDKPITDVRPSSEQWTEVLTSSYVSPNEIINVIKHGWKRDCEIERHNLIICCKSYADTLMGVFIPADALRYDGTSYFFTEDTMQVEVGEVYVENLLQYKGCNKVYNILPSLDDWQMTDYEPVWSIDEILDSVISNLISKIDKSVLTRKERQAARSALDKISENTIVEAVAERIGCSEEEAIGYVSNYIKTRKFKLDDNQISAFISMLIEGDTNAVKALREQIRTEWEQNNTDLLDEAKRAIDDAKADLQNIADKKSIVQSELNTLNRKRVEIESQIEDASQLRSEIESEITKLLDDISVPKAETIVKRAFLDAAITQQMGVLQTTTVPVMNRGQAGYSIRYSPTTLQIKDDSIAANYDVAVESIEKYCVEDIGQRELMLFLFAAYACKQHLIMTGETAEALALMYASSITGADCPVISLHENADITSAASELKMLPHSIVAVRERDAACYERLRELMRLLPDTQFVRLIDHEESLLMEPKSLYTTFIPVLTDVFCQSTELSVPDSFDCSKAFTDESLTKISHKEMSATKTKWRKRFGNAIHSPLLEHRCARIQLLMQRLAVITGNTAREATLAGRIFLFMPLMKCLNNTDKISEWVQLDTDMTSQTKAIIRSYCGIEDDYHEPY